MKIVLPPICLIYCLMTYTLAFLNDARPNKFDLSGLFSLAVPLLFNCLIWYPSIRLKVVSVDDQYLYVSNYLKEECIPLSDIDHVTEDRWLSGHPVTLHLRSRGEFGDKIVFLPTMRLWMWAQHPVVAELQGLATLSR